MKMCREKGRERERVKGYTLRSVSSGIFVRPTNRSRLFCVLSLVPLQWPLISFCSKEREQHEMIMCAGGNYLADGST